MSKSKDADLAREYGFKGNFSSQIVYFLKHYEIEITKKKVKKEPKPANKRSKLTDFYMATANISSTILCQHEVCSI